MSSYAVSRSLLLAEMLTIRWNIPLPSVQQGAEVGVGGVASVVFSD